MASPLPALSQIIASGISTIEFIYGSHGATFPSLDEPFQTPSFCDPALELPIKLVMAAAAQLIASLAPPATTVIHSASSYFSAASLGVVADLNVVEVLREAGPQGLHIRDIAERCGTDANKIGRILRYLATTHIFREVSPDVFTNNRLSSVIDTGKTLGEIKARPLEKYDNTSGISALIGHCAEDGFKSSSHIIDAFRDPTTLSSQDPLAAPFNRAFDVPLHFFEWCELPGNERRLRRFGAAMKGSTEVRTPDAALAGFGWASTKKDSIVVDVGGGIGSTSMKFAKSFPHLRFVVQDRPAVVAEGIKYWEREYPGALTDGRVQFQEHNFFNPQPIKDASLFFMRFIMHDWPNEQAKKILKHLGDAAQPSTKLMLLDIIVPYSTLGDADVLDAPIDAPTSPIPYPLLANLGIASMHMVAMDMHMMTMHNSQERTIGQFIDLVDGTGWKLELVRPGIDSTLSCLLFAHISQ